MVSASICTIGDEILIGQIVDTNSAFISKELNAIGVKVEKMISIGDDKEIINNTLAALTSTFNITIITGGLGPTKDDITRDSLYKISESSGWIRDEKQLRIIEKICKRRGVEMLESNIDQALIPNKCSALENKIGTAPGIVYFNNIKGSMVVSLPGVPYEMRALFDQVKEYIKTAFAPGEIVHKTICTFGMPESLLSDKIEPWELNLPSKLKLAYLPNPLSGIKLRLSSYTGDVKEANIMIQEQVEKLRALIGNIIYNEKESTLQETIAELLISSGDTLCVAESCTGGKISSLFTSIPGASKFFYGGVVSYDNSVKENILGVKNETLVRFGAVSEECVKEMAVGVSKALNTRFSIATSGIAGPTGGTDDKPVGTIWIAVHDSLTNKTITKHGLFNSDRERNIERFSAEAMNLLRTSLLI